MIFKCLPTHQDWRCLNKHEGNFYLQVHRPPYRGSFGIRNVTLKKKPETHPGIFLLTAKNQKNLRFKRFGELKCSDAPVQKPGDVLGEPSITFPGGVSECNAKKLEAPKTNLSVGCFLMAEDGARDYTKMNGCFRPDFKQTKQKKNAKCQVSRSRTPYRPGVRNTRNVFFWTILQLMLPDLHPLKNVGVGGVSEDPIIQKTTWMA